MKANEEVFKMLRRLNGQDLPQKSLTLTSQSRSDNNRQSRSANNTLHVDFTPTKIDFSLTYEVLSLEDYNFLLDIYAQQVSSLNALVFELEDTESIKTYNVYMPPLSVGSSLPQKGFYYSVDLELAEI